MNLSIEGTLKETSQHLFMEAISMGIMDELKVAIEKYATQQSLNFSDWLMTNCELSEDKTIWSYDSEDYSLEGLYKVFQKL